MLKFPATFCRHYFTKIYGKSNESESVDLPLRVDQRIHNPDSDSSHITSASVDLKNLDSTDYGCEIHIYSVIFHLSYMKEELFFYPTHATYPQCFMILCYL